MTLEEGTNSSETSVRSYHHSLCNNQKSAVLIHCAAEARSHGFDYALRSCFGEVTAYVGVRAGSGNAHSVVTWLRAGGKRVHGSIPGRKKRLYYTPKRPHRLRDLNKPPFHLALGSLSRGIKRPESVADQSRPSIVYIHISVENYNFACCFVWM